MISLEHTSSETKLLCKKGAITNTHASAYSCKRGRIDQKGEELLTHRGGWEMGGKKGCGGQEEWAERTTSLCAMFCITLTLGIPYDPQISNVA